MRSLQDARRCWPSFLELGSIEELRSSVRHRSPSLPAGLRSVCWKSFLLFETVDRTKWPSILADSRTSYTSMKAHFLEAIEHPDELASTADPLSDSIESPWNALRQDEALRAEIFQDVERCMPDNLYFRQPSTQNMLLDILFVFCKLNPDVGYRQGMHELLAPILWVVERDAVDTQSMGKDTHGPDDGRALLFEVLRADFIEHDAFTLFRIVMRGAKSFYESGGHGKSASRNPTSQGSAQQSDSPLMLRSKRIFEEHLMQADPGLACHLKNIEIAPQIFLMKWIRLLFGREFPFDDILNMWDLLFAEDPSLGLVDMVCVAMLLRIRWQLIEADINTALSLLLRYPESDSPNRARTFVEDALYLKENLSPDGGSFIIAKHTKRRPPLLNRIEAKQSTPISTPIRSPQRTHSPLVSPSKSQSGQAGLEFRLQDAARGLYERGEKWGLSKAVREAVGEVRRNVQGLQSARESPRPKVDDEFSLESPSDDVLQRIAALEERNKALAKMLGKAVAELWEHEKTMTSSTGPEKESGSQMGAAIAKVQFVQVFLEDSSIQLSPDEGEPVNRGSTPLASKKPRAEPSASKANQSREEPPQGQTQQTADASQNADSKRATAPKSLDIPKPSGDAPPNNFPFHRPRPSLAYSSFSWMLGEDQKPSSFVAATNFSRETRRVRGPKGFLFGEEDAEASTKHDGVEKTESEEIGLGTIKR